MLEHIRVLWEHQVSRPVFLVQLVPCRPMLAHHRLHHARRAVQVPFHPRPDPQHAYSVLPVIFHRTQGLRHVLLARWATLLLVPAIHNAQPAKLVILRIV